MTYTSFIWDLDDEPTGNVQHCAQHGLTKDEVAEVLANSTNIDLSHSSGWPVVFGDTSTDRHVMVVYEEIDDDTAYPITAFEVPRRQKT